MKEKRYIGLENVYIESPIPMKELIDFLNEKLLEIPEEFQDTAEFEINAYTEYGSAYYQTTITYVRPETDEEEEFRERAIRKEDKWKREKDLQLLAELKRKYEENK